MKDQIKDLQKISTRDVQSLVHELQVHQIELKMQNEELRRTQSELEESRNRYSDIYNFAPVSYFTFDKNGLILDVNFTGANKLGVERSFLIKKPFSLYVAFSSRDVFSLHMRQVFRTETKQTCEIRFAGKNGNQFDALLKTLAVKDAMGNFSQCRTAMIDVTERNKAEAVIHESEERYRSLVESANDIIAMVSPDGTIISLNPAFEKITGWAREEWLGKNFPPLIHPDDLPEASKVFQHTMSGKTMPSSELRLLESSGGYINVEYVTTPIFKDGKVIGNLNIVRDITERKRAEEALRRANDVLEIRVAERTAELAKANEDLKTEIAERKQSEEALRESEEKYRNLFDNAGDAIINIDNDARVTSWNRSAETIFGWTAGEAIGRKFDELIVPRDLQAEFKRNVQDSIARKNITGIATVRKRKDGSRVDVGLTISAIINAEGKIIGLSGIFRDITELKRAEEALLKAHDELELRIKERTAELQEANKALVEGEASYRELTESINDPFYAMDRDLIYTYWNKASESLSGILAKDAIGKSIYELFPDVKGTEVEQFYIEALKAQQPERFESDYKLGDKNFIFEINAYPTKTGLSVIAKDITEKKNLEKQLLRAQRMESIGTLAGGIAHDLNNVLTPMMLSLQLLKEKFKDEQSQKLLTILEKNSQRGADLIKQVLSFARGVEGERTPLQAAHLISEIEKVAKETFPRNIEISCDIKKDLLIVSGDATQLHQVIMNLCVNARDAMPDGGILSITASNFFIDENYQRMHSEAKAGSYVAISVSDTGTGIPPRILDRIFEPFFTTKEFGKGTGLGLSTALAIVKSHGGFINVYSEVGKGTIFRVYLPAIKTEVQKEEELLKLFSGHGEMILVAEDEGSIREITSSALETYGYKVLTADDGAAAVALYAQNKDKIKVILMDIMMPVMDGHASIRAIYKINPEVKVIAVSGLAEKDKLANIAASHVKAFLPKPYTAEKLLKTIHEVIGTEQNSDGI